MGEEPVVLDLLTLEEFLEAQKREWISLEPSKFVGSLHSCFHYDRFGILVRKARLNEVLQEVVPKRLRHKLLHLA